MGVEGSAGTERGELIHVVLTGRDSVEWNSMSHSPSARCM